MKVSQKHPDMQNYKNRIGNRRQEYQQAVKDNKEQGIYDIFKEPKRC